MGEGNGNKIAEAAALKYDEYFEDQETHVSEKQCKYLSTTAIPLQNNTEEQMDAENINQPQNEVVKDAVMDMEPSSDLLQDEAIENREEPAVEQTSSKILDQNAEVSGEPMVTEPDSSSNLLQDEVLENREVPVVEQRTLNLPQNEEEKLGGELAEKPKHDKERRKRHKRHCKRVRYVEVQVGEPGQPGLFENEVQIDGGYGVLDRNRHHKRERALAGEQERAIAAKIPINDKDPEPNQNHSRMPSTAKMYKTLKVDHERVKRQHLKIRNLQVEANNQIIDFKRLEALVKKVDEKINTTYDDMLTFKVTIT